MSDYKPETVVLLDRGVLEIIGVDGKDDQAALPTMPILHADFVWYLCCVFIMN